jgi:hypothetical protein
LADYNTTPIDIGVGHTVLSRGYGDCKDKANLMRAMLKVLKIEAYPIAIFSGDPTFTREEWASPDQFNHCITAVKVSDETKSPTVIEHSALGRLLIFDATDTFCLIQTRSKKRGFLLSRRALRWTKCPTR